VNEVDDPQRVVFLLRYVEELNLSEIADVTGLNRGALKSHISRALMKVRAALKPAQINILAACL
jgi:RNA polymerase sigma-70 factor, ECF subfamily